jgi:L-lactate dehydrogenase complex protein LldG
MRSPGGRDAILQRIREVTADRPPSDHPGDFQGSRPTPLGDPVDVFEATFTAAGGEVIRAGTQQDARDWLRRFMAGFASAAIGPGVPRDVIAELSPAPPESAALGVSMARGAVAETGSLLLGAEDGRRVQLLPPTHVVWVPADTVYPTLRDALEGLAGDLPSALGLHSGPSKSADIGQILVQGVHGPGRVIALLVEVP